MSSERRIRASRANGARSRGPKTPESKARSAANSLRHGLLAKTIVLEHEETAGSFAELLAAFERDLNPQTELERSLVENMAVARWRLRRVWALEKTTLQLEMNQHNPGSNDPFVRAALSFRTLSDQSRALNLLNRYETCFDRQFARALTLFLKVREAFQPIVSEDTPEAKPAENEICQTNLIPKTDTPVPAQNPAPERLRAAEKATPPPSAGTCPAAAIPSSALTIDFPTVPISFEAAG